MYKKNKNISILGTTGSIGSMTLEVVDTLGYVKVVAMACNSNINIFEKQIRKYKPEVVCVYDEKKAKELKILIKDLDVKIYSGLDGLIEISTYKKNDLLVNAVVGIVGLLPTIKAIKSHINIAIANKETIVCAGNMLMDLVKKNKVNLYPIDSEHSAIFQCLQGNDNNKIEKILLTGSGGNFFDKKLEDFDDIKVEDVIHHKNWNMGRKISIDSSTLVNKGLEIIEASYLFDVNYKNIEVVISPKSLIHSMVQFCDGSVIAQLSSNDMKLPIQYSITYPKREKNNIERIDFFKLKYLDFYKINYNIFHTVDLAYESLKIGGSMPIVYNCSNEVAVDLFIKNKIKFLDIQKIIQKEMNKHKLIKTPSLEDIFAIKEEIKQKYYL